MSETRFCEHCGATLAAYARFCETCGRSVSAPSMPITPQAATPSSAPAQSSRPPWLIVGGVAVVAVIACALIAGGGFFAYQAAQTPATPTMSVFVPPALPPATPTVFVFVPSALPPATPIATLPPVAPLPPPSTPITPSSALAPAEIVTPTVTLTLAPTPAPTSTPLAQGNCADPNARWENVTDGQTIGELMAFIGTAAGDDFAEYRVLAGTPGTVLFRSSTPVVHGVIFIWNTLTVGTGDYLITLVVSRKDGTNLATCALTIHVRH